jgi:hypothetical protein
MKQQPGFVANTSAIIIAFFLSLAILVTKEIVKKIVWPLLRFVAKVAWKGIRKLVAKSKVEKTSKPTAQLPTPDVFKGAPNLARARQVRF